ncbi:inorganic phosphate transporter [Scheffersomyces stipitis CBS 6054]|uniref:Inorganic phosphate transporter n=1 Tax=Scheffersomyces stipitis (strain ATCC 58785 / CBS 6054 / NBRC 10063 / NRRL Y-11545) TaxID=322104 RepID=A3GFF7_PICST|nr:inorganic phosphate transporter [Scheffersomyces stipitis CBS 6054]EAZ63748.1 inorganic phosphate transporter [Scheffersomyces stipitis CBS 6054]
MLELEGDDKAMARKIYLVNNALDEIGFTWFHVKCFVVAGYGYVADSLLGMAQSTVATYVNLQFNQTYPLSTQVLYIGLFSGCVFWGLSGDIIGRKLAFNLTLFLCAILSFLVGAMSSFPMYCFMLAISSFALGGNLAIDATVFLEFLPFNYQWLTTFFACWWSLGQAVGYGVAYAFVVPEKWHCTSADNCPSESNRGWRYVWYVDAGIVFFFAVIRLMLKLEETPKFLVTNNRDAECVEQLQAIAKKYNRTCSLTLEDLQACGEVKKNDFKMSDPKLKDFFSSSIKNSKALFSTKKMSINTLMLFMSWFGIGIAYPLWGTFLPVYIASKGGHTSADDAAGVYGDALLSTCLSFFGPVIGGLLILIPRVGRRGTLCIGGITSMIFFMAYTTVRTRPGALGFSTAAYICIYIYYGCLYGYTPECLPSYCRATGSGLAFVFNRIAGLIVPVIAYYAKPTTSVPIWVCASFIGLIGIGSLFFPFEPSRQRSV